MGELARQALEADGVDVWTGRQAIRARPDPNGDGQGTLVDLDGGATVATDIIALAAGAGPPARRGARRRRPGPARQLAGGHRGVAGWQVIVHDGADANRKATALPSWGTQWVLSCWDARGPHLIAGVARLHVQTTGKFDPGRLRWAHRSPAS